MKDGQVSLLGLPWDASSSHSRGPALAPAVIRAVLNNPASSPYSIDNVDIRDVISHEDFSGLPEDAAEARSAIERRVGDAITSGRKPLSLGGDHSVTYPILKAIAAAHGPVNVLHVDAHPDLYEDYEGDRYSHACPFARALEDGLIGTLVQVGIRCSAPHLASFGERYGVIMLGADEANRIPYDRLTGPTYMTIDLDGLDPAFAPGVSHPEPGGLATREVLAMIKRIPGDLVGADIVELNPERDINLLTAHVAVRFVKELCAALSVSR